MLFMFIYLMIQLIYLFNFVSILISLLEHMKLFIVS